MVVEEALAKLPYDDVTVQTPSGTVSPVSLLHLASDCFLLAPIPDQLGHTVQVAMP